MKNTRVSTVAVAATAALGLAACGGGGGSGAGTTGGTTAAGGGTVKVGIKFDQPGLGLKAGSDYTGMDVDLARYIAREVGLGTPDFVEAISAQRETLISTGQVRYIVGTYSITDARKERVSFAGPYFVAGQDLLVRAEDTSITGKGSLSGKRLCSVKGSTSAINIQQEVPGVNLQEYGTYTLCVDALKAGSVDALTTDNTILAGYAAQEANRGKLRVVGQPFSTENYGVGLRKGDTEFCTKVTDAVKKFVSDGSWQKSVDANLGPANFKPGPGNPPTPASCS